MTGLEIGLITAGIVIFIASFIVPELKQDTDEESRELLSDAAKEIVEEQMKEAGSQLKEAADEAVSYAVEKSERSLERLSNEKITAISEFSETVLGDIHKNHQEVMFLYDMLHDKQVNLKETVKEADRVGALVREKKNEAEHAVQEAERSAALQESAPSGEKKEGKEKGPAASGKKEQSADVDGAADPSRLPSVEKSDGSSTNSNAVILQLHKQGKSNVAIARELGLGVGEVNLVIDLFEVM